MKTLLLGLAFILSACGQSPVQSQANVDTYCSVLSCDGYSAHKAYCDNLIPADQRPHVGTLSTCRLQE